ncbi:CU044_2847 family protein [Nonomuraea sp. NPDC049309]|uniref:CU044_2847 family protein n=1 Tax=Nonomuraea sp. NPDC049309 TaxID=3364350 RepID=UPI00372109C5
MTELVRWELEDGGTVLVESGSGEETDGGWESAGIGAGTLRQAKLRLEESLSDVRDAAAAALRTFRDLPIGPDEVELEFGVKLQAEVGAVVAKGKTEGQLVVRLRWQASDRSDGQAPGPTGQNG